MSGSHELSSEELGVLARLLDKHLQADTTTNSTDARTSSSSQAQVADHHVDVVSFSAAASTTAAFTNRFHAHAAHLRAEGGAAVVSTAGGGGDGASSHNGLLRGSSSSSSSLPSEGYEPDEKMSMKPSAMVQELDRYIIGQADAKRSVAIACRQRWRRHKLPASIKNDVTPKNILMVGPTGCGKTEIARRLAKLTFSPFIKVEATKYTEVGFHGKDVDTIIHDLLRVAIQQEQQKRKAKSAHAVRSIVDDKLLDALIGTNAEPRTKETFRQRMADGIMEEVFVEMEVPVRATPMDEKQQQLVDKLGVKQNRRQTERRSLPVREARRLLIDDELDVSISKDEVVKAAIRAVEEDGIVFLDEIDKIASSSSSRGADASADGVQRDLLPLIEGTTVNTKHGDVKTDHILFIASGAFHSVKPSDLLAELQGRLPVRVELRGLSENDMYRILTETKQNLLHQQTQLLAIDKIKLTFTEGAVKEMARIATELNRTIENIGARRLATVVERIIGELSYEAADMEPGTEVVIDVPQVQERMSELMKSTDLQKYIL